MWTAPSSACRPAVPRSSRSQRISRTAYATARSAIPRATWYASISCPSRWTDSPKWTINGGLKASADRLSLPIIDIATLPSLARLFDAGATHSFTGDSVRRSVPVRNWFAAAAAGVLLAGVVAAPAYADDGGLTGTVTDLATGAPIAGACVIAVAYDSGAEA